jgi:CBS domain-containing protein
MSQIPVQDLMNRQVPTVLENASLNDAAIALLEHDSSEVYVVNRGGVLRGIVPDYEILKARLCGVSRDQPIDELITRTLQTVGPWSPAASVASLFREGYRSSMAVVDDKGRLLGQLKRKELIWLLTTLDRLEQPDLDEVNEPELTTDHNAPPNRASVPKPNFLRSSQRHREILAQQIDKSLNPPAD